MKNLVLVFLSIALFPITSLAQSSEPDSAYINLDPLQFYSLTAVSDPLIIDSTDLVQLDPIWYDKALRHRTFLQQTGNFGSAINDLLKRNNSSNLINNGFDQYDRSMMHAVDNRIELPDLRYTNIDYHLASKKEQHIFVTHNQRFRPWIVAGLKFGAQISPGEFTGQEKNILNFNIYSLLSTRSQVYGVYLSFVSNRVLNEENGGLINDSTFINASKLETKTMRVNLNNAYFKNKTREYFARQEFMPWKNNSSYIKGKLGLRHNFRYHRQSLIFESFDSEPGYFANFYFDSTSTFDSSFVESLTNSGEIFYRSQSDNMESALSLGVQHQVVEYYTNGVEYEPQTTALTLNAYRKSEYLSVGFDAKFGIDGFGKEDMIIELTSEFKKDSVYTLNARVAYRNARPNLRDLLYVSNHFAWDNRNFNKESKLSYNVAFKLPNYRTTLSVDGRLMQDFIYYESDQLPQFYSEYAGVTEFKLKNFTYWGRLGVESGVSFFYTSDNKVLPVPVFAFREQLFFRSLLFRGAVNFKSGFIVRYNTEYKSQAFMPATGVFYRQNNTRTGGYFYVDYFMNFKIKSTTIFIMLEHLNSGISERTYFLTPNYPMPGRAFKFGFSWNFKD